MSKVSAIALCTILVVLGLFNVFLGINVGFGGIETLGWQVQAKFFEVTNETVFLVRDSHIRFYGGLYVGIGLFLLLAVTDLHKHQSALNLVFALIFIGGLARFSMLRPDVLFGPDILTSLVAELVLMPVLYVWLSNVVKMNTIKANTVKANIATSSM